MRQALLAESFGNQGKGPSGERSRDSEKISCPVEWKKKLLDAMLYSGVGVRAVHLHCQALNRAVARLKYEWPFPKKEKSSGKLF